MPVLIAVWFLFLCKCLPIKLLHQLLRKLDIVERGPEDSDEEPQSTLHGHDVPTISVYMFTFYLSFTCVIIGTVFINTLLVQRTTSCDADVDCFLVDSSASLDLSKQDLPVNCSSLTDDSLFVCYKFQFDLTNALAVAGGLITIAKLTINITTSVLSWLMNRQTRKGKIIIMFIVISSILMFYCIFIIALVTFREFAQKATTSFFLTAGVIPILQLTVLFLTVIAATFAVAGVHFPTFANTYMSADPKLLFTLCCKCKHYGYIQIEHNDL